MKSAGHVAGEAEFLQVRATTAQECKGQKEERRNTYTREQSKKNHTAVRAKQRMQYGPRRPSCLGHTCPMHRNLVGEKWR